MKKHIVAQISELPVGSSKVVQLDNIEVGLFNIENQFYAIKNICPHQGASLCKGVVTGTNLPSNVGQYVYGRDGEILRCPWHNWEFDIKTGIALCDEASRVATYKVVQEGENLVLYR